MNQPALFDLTPSSSTTHVLMPSMGYACGQSMLDVGGRFTVGLTDWDAVDCPGCRDIGPATIRTQIDREQRAQA